jgi:hypothetical protein
MPKLPACKARDQAKKKKKKPRRSRRRKGGIGTILKKGVDVAKKIYQVAKPGYRAATTVKKVGEGDAVGLLREGVTTAATKFAPILGIASIAGALTDLIKKKGAPYYPPHMWKGGIPGQPLHLHNQGHKKTCRRTNWGRECMLPHQWPKWKKKWPLVA